MHGYSLISIQAPPLFFKLKQNKKSSLYNTDEMQMCVMADNCIFYQQFNFKQHPQSYYYRINIDE